MKTWNQVLDEWENGIFLRIPSDIKSAFIWRTSVINSKKDLEYKDEFIIDKRLPNKKQDLKPFSQHLSKKKNLNEKYGISFPNLSGDTILVIPKPKKGKDYTSIFYFIKNSSLLQQREFWKIVAKEIKKMLKKYDNIWVSTHGLGVDYLHVRICSYPKYYEKSKLQKV